MATFHRSTKKQLLRGMTFIELLIGLVIIGMGMTIAIPSFQNMLARNTMSTQVNEFMLTLLRARSEASKTGTNVSILGESAATAAGHLYNPSHSESPPRDASRKHKLQDAPAAANTRTRSS